MNGAESSAPDSAGVTPLELAILLRSHETSILILEAMQLKHPKVIERGIATCIRNNDQSLANAVVDTVERWNGSGTFVTGLRKLVSARWP
jgi:hypothetical protein